LASVSPVDPPCSTNSGNFITDNNSSNPHLVGRCRVVMNEFHLPDSSILPNGLRSYFNSIGRNFCIRFRALGLSYRA
jgi:hypothetical protein